MKSADISVNVTPSICALPEIVRSIAVPLSKCEFSPRSHGVFMYLRVRLTSTALRSREVRSRPRWKDAWGSKCDSDVKVVGLGWVWSDCDATRRQVKNLQVVVVSFATGVASRRLVVEHCARNRLLLLRCFDSKGRRPPPRPH